MPTLLVGDSVHNARTPSDRGANTRTYTLTDTQGQTVAVRMPSRAAVQRAVENSVLLAQSVFLCGVEIEVDGRAQRIATVEVTPTTRGRRTTYTANFADTVYGQYVASSGSSGAAILDYVSRAINGDTGARSVRATSGTRTVQAAAVRHIPAVEALGWADDFASFSSVYRSVRDSQREHPEFHDTLLGDFHRVGTLATTGRSFGLEIEVDFPNSTSWGYEKRTLARRLFEAGLSVSDQVRGWHYAARADNGRGQSAGYTSDRNRWTVEYDRSVDDCAGERGCEVVSPILYDTPETWQDVKTVIDIITELGGEVSVRHGLHVNIGASDLAGDALSHVTLVRSLRHFDDLLVRLSHTPENGRWHRGRSYCARIDDTGIGNYMSRGIERYSAEIISNVVAYNGHRAAVNFTHMPVNASRVATSTRLEFRIFDGTLNVGRIQTNVMLCMALVAAAIRNTDTDLFASDEEFGGAHLGQRTDRRRLTGDAWKTDTERVREFVDYLALDSQAAEDVVTCYVASRWQRA